MRKFLPAIILSCFLFIQHSFGQTPTEVTFNGIPNLANGDLDWGDYDGDGDKDLLISGWDGVAPITRLYERDGIDFITVPFAFPNVYNGDVGFVDVNADGLLDVYITGEGVEDYYFDLFLNLGQGDFEELPLSVQGIANSQVVWKDLSGDGYLDLIYTGTDKTGNPITDFQVWDGDQYFLNGDLDNVFDGQISINTLDGIWDVMISGTETIGSRSVLFYKFIGNELTSISRPLEKYSFNSGSVIFQDLTGNKQEDFILIPYSGNNVVVGKNLGNYFFDEKSIEMEIFFPKVDTSEVAEVVNFISVSSAPYFPLSVPEIGWPNMEIRFGQGSQLAHRFTAEMQGQGVSINQYIYEDYIEVPFQIWDIDNNRQLMVSFRDQQEDGEWNLIPRNLNDEDPSGDSREYIFIHLLDYEETPNEDIMENLSFQSMSLWWMVAQNGPTNVSEFGSANISISKTVPAPGELPGPGRVTAFDFDLDSLQDVITATVFSNPTEGHFQNLVIDFYLNDGDLGLTLENRLVSHWEDGISNIDFADFNGDGLKDIVLDQFGSLSIFLNQDGTFINNPISYILNEPVGYADFNKDGLFDLIDGTGEIYIAQTDGNLLEFEEFTRGPEPTFFGNLGHHTIGDFNNDGFDDVIMTDGEYIRYQAINLNGTEFEITEPQWIQENNDLIVTGISNEDINNDGYPDILIEGFSESGLSFKVLLNDGNGGMNLHPVIGFDLTEAMQFATSLEIAFLDIDGDGLKDLQLLPEINADLYSYVFSYGNDGFRERQLETNQYILVSSRNMDSTGEVELVALSNNLSQNKIQIVQLNDVLEIELLSEVLDSGFVKTLNAVDNDVDGDLDLVYSLEDESGMIHKVLNNTGNYEFTASEFITVSGNHQIIVDDFNGDNLVDYSLISNEPNNPETIFYLNGGTNFMPVKPSALKAEINGNEVLITWQLESADSVNLRYNYKIWNDNNPINSGADNGTFSLNTDENQFLNEMKLQLRLDSGLYLFAVQSINHSLAGSEFSDSLHFTVSKSVVNPLFKKQKIINTISEVSFSDFADIDNDNDLDFVYFDGEFKIAINQNAQFFIQALSLDVPFSVSAPKFSWGDIDGDNDNDLALMDLGGTLIFENQGDYRFRRSTFSQLVTLPGSYTGREGVSLLLEDINGDNELDVLMTGFNQDQENFTGVFLNLGNGRDFKQINTNIREFAIFNTEVYDFNGDGINDIYINPSRTLADTTSTGLPYILLGTKSARFDQEIIIPEGVDPFARSYIVDYDNDGDWDIVFSDGQIARNSEGQFELEPLFEAVKPFAQFKMIDYNSDGFRDIVSIDLSSIEWYENSNGNFNNDSNNLPDLGFGRQYTVDLNQDGDIDILSNKYRKGPLITNVLEIYKNQSSISHADLNVPSSLRHSFNEAGEVILHWEESNESVSHNVVVWTENELIVSPNSDTLSGFRTINKHGNSGFANSLNLGPLKEGTYYWKVQNISQDTYIGGKFSPTSSFEISIFTEVATLANIVEDLQVLDIDNDNDLDIYYSDIYYNNQFELVSDHIILINEGDLQFTPVELSIDQNFSQSGLGDINKDGWIDLVLNGPDFVNPATGSATNMSVSTYANTGQNSFTPRRLRDINGTNAYPLFGHMVNGTVHIADLNNDGREDILINGSNSTNYSRIIANVEENATRGKVSFLIQDDEFNFEEIEFLKDIGPVNGVSVSDYNGDGYLDLASFDNFFSFTPSANIFTTVGYGINVVQQFSNEQFADDTGVAWIDVDNDNDLDLIFNGSFGENINDNRLLTETSADKLVHTIDFNDDGIMDGYSIIQQNTIYYIGTENGFEKFDDSGEPYRYMLLEVADLDDDGIMELMVNKDGMLRILKADFKNSSSVIDVPTIVNSSSVEDQIILNWNPILSKGFTYNVEVRLDNELIVSSHSDSTGFRRLSRYGNAYMNDFFLLNTSGLDDGLYTWKVQAVSPSFKGGMFSTPAKFSVCTEFNKIDFEIPENAGVNSTLKFNLINVPENQEISYSWNFGDGTENTSTEFHQYLSSGDYNVTTLITNSFGCEKMISKELSVSDIIPVRVSNVITPNNDGKNDVLFIENIERYPDNKVRFLTLDGQQLFEATGYQNDWSPTEKGFELASGTYICLLKLTENDFERKVLVRVIR